MEQRIPGFPESGLACGMLARTLLIEGESLDRLDDLVEGLFAEFQPRTPSEISLIEMMAAARWRLMRIRGIEKEALNDRMGALAGPASSAAGERAATRVGLAFRRLADDCRLLDLIGRCEWRYARQYFQAHRRLLAIQRRGTPGGAPTPGPAVVVPIRGPRPAAA